MLNSGHFFIFILFIYFFVKPLLTFRMSFKQIGKHTDIIFVRDIQYCCKCFNRNVSGTYSVYGVALKLNRFQISTKILTIYFFYEFLVKTEIGNGLSIFY